MKICPQCEARYPVEATFCSEDGADLVAVATRVCDLCGRPVEASAAWCHGCGSRLHGGAFAAAAAPNHAGVAPQIEPLRLLSEAGAFGVAALMASAFLQLFLQGAYTDVSSWQSVGSRWLLALLFCGAIFGWNRFRARPTVADSGGAANAATASRDLWIVGGTLAAYALLCALVPGEINEGARSLILWWLAPMLLGASAAGAALVASGRAAWCLDAVLPAALVAWLANWFLSLSDSFDIFYFALFGALIGAAAGVSWNTNYGSQLQQKIESYIARPDLPLAFGFAAVSALGLAVAVWLATYSLQDSYSGVLMSVAKFAAFSLLIAVGQWLVLRRHTDIDASWIAATVAGLAAGALAWGYAVPEISSWAFTLSGVGSGSWLGNQLSSLISLLMACVSGALAGVLVGGAQWFIVRERVPKMWWLGVSALGAAVASALQFWLMGSYFDSDNFSWLTFLLCGAIVGTLQGAVLASSNNGARVAPEKFLI